MANRTLRRAYGGISGDEGQLSGIIEGDVGSKPDGDGTVESVDNATVTDGPDTIGDTERDSSIGSVTIDPADLDAFIAGDSADSGSDNGTGKRPRKKRGPNKRTTGAKKAQDSIAPFIMMVHTLMAATVPEMAMTESEAERVSSAYVNFCEHHDIPILSAKRMSEIELVSMIWMVYGTRVIAIRNRIKEDAKIAAAKKVTPITQHG